jgi:hypothetical protein
MSRVPTLALCALLSAAGSPALADAAYQNFKAAIYVPVNAVRQLQDSMLREQQYRRIAQQLRFDKVYLETYRGGQFADDAALEQLKKFFTDKGVAVAGGIALDAPGHAGQFATLDYENPDDRATCRRAVELAARHFDEVILDDFSSITARATPTSPPGPAAAGRSTGWRRCARWHRTWSSNRPGPPIRGYE